MLEKYLAFKNLGQSIEPAELNKAEELESLLLDALIFYDGCYLLIRKGIPEQNVSALLDTFVSDQKTLKQVDADALSLIDTFTLKNKMTLGSFDSVDAMLQKTNFPDAPDFLSLIMYGFNLFKKKIEQSNDDVNKAIGYSAIAQFALKLYEAFKYVYMDVYLAGAFDAEENVATAVNAEVNKILAPPGQYIG